VLYLRQKVMFTIIEASARKILYYFVLYMPASVSTGILVFY
jgi:hypothetical protein